MRNARECCRLAAACHQVSSFTVELHCRGNELSSIQTVFSDPKPVTRQGPNVGCQLLARARRLTRENFWSRLS